MRAGGMGNLLETDSDVASISDNEKERTDGDGMESDALLDTNKNVGSEVPAGAADTAPEKGQNSSSEQSLDSVPPVAGNINYSTANSSLALADSSPNSTASPTPRTAKVVTVSPRELPPRSQLIQLKPTLVKPKLSSRNSSDAIPEGMNKQKNPRFIPYEPYRGAVRSMVAQDDSSKRHSRTASDASISSLTLEQAMNNISIGETKPDEISERHSQCLGSKKNTQELSAPERKATVGNINVNFQVKKQDQVIEKQQNALTLLKERLKIAEKDNNDLHKENTRLKKLLVDSLSGDVIPGRVDHHINNHGMRHGANQESEDALSNEIEVWRSKFLSSCVLVDQLTRENATLHDAVGSAANILKEIKLASSLSPEHFDEVNAWLRQNRGTSPASLPNCSNSEDNVT